MKFCFILFHIPEGFNFSKKIWELNIMKYNFIIFQELFSEFNYLNNFLSYIVMKCFKRIILYLQNSTDSNELTS